MILGIRVDKFARTTTNNRESIEYFVRTLSRAAAVWARYRDEARSSLQGIIGHEQSPYRCDHVDAQPESMRSETHPVKVSNGSGASTLMGLFDGKL